MIKSTKAVKKNMPGYKTSLLLYTTDRVPDQRILAGAASRLNSACGGFYNCKIMSGTDSPVYIETTQNITKGDSLRGKYNGKTDAAI